MMQCSVSFNSIMRVVHARVISFCVQIEDCLKQSLVDPGGQNGSPIRKLMKVRHHHWHADSELTFATKFSLAGLL